jgi:predicted nucleic acid-binding protein
VTERWVLNASPLIVLSKIGQAHLFTELAESVVPNAVVAEIMAGPEDDPARQFMREHGRLKIIETASVPAELLAWDLGAGETAVLAYALANPGWTAILDDNAARKCDRSFSVPVKGTLAVVITARQEGLIPSAAGVLHQLQAHDFRIKEDIVREALRLTVNETW